MPCEVAKEESYYRAFIGCKVEKISNRPFKSGLKINTIKAVSWCEEFQKWAYLFNEDDSYVECHRCKPFTEPKRNG